MTAAVAAFLEAQPLFTLFLTIALGYLVGEIGIGGLSLGSGAVLFVGLAIGAIAPKSAPPALVGTLGLLLFLYGVGLAYGREFFRGLTSAAGVKANLAAACGVVVALAVALGSVALMSVGIGPALGMFAGAGTSTATLQAVTAVLRSDAPTVGYSVAYPFGVAVPILVLFLARALFKPKVTPVSGQRLEIVEVELDPTRLPARSVAELLARVPAGIDVVAIRRDGHNVVPHGKIALRGGDCLMLAGTEPNALQSFAARLGNAAPGRMHGDRTDLEYVRVFASRKNVVGVPLGSLEMPFRFDHRIVHVRRGDADLLPREDLVLEFGDRVGVLVPPEHRQEVAQFFGDSIRGTAEFSYVSIGVGAAIGLLIGLVPIPIPGVGTVTLGLAGVLLFALWLGKQRRVAGLTFTLPLSASLVLRNFGLTVFLAQVGLASGRKFVQTVADTGFTYLAIGAVIAFVLAAVTLAVAMLVFRLPFDQAAGVMSGATGNPAILGFANKLAPTERTDIAYAMIFPSMTVLKILIVEIAAVVLGGSG